MAVCWADSFFPVLRTIRQFPQAPIPRIPADWGLHFRFFCAISVNCYQRKIIGDAAERGSVTGCKPTCGRPIWFAREPPWRHGRFALRYQGHECAPQAA